MSDIILVTPSAAGLLNHSVALALCLEASGLACVLVSGPEAEQHLEEMGSPVPFSALHSHALSFDRRDAARISHFQQVADSRWCRTSTEELLHLVQRERPRWIIAKNSPQVALVSEMSKIPWAAYLTGGPMHLDPTRNPLLTKVSTKALQDLQAVSEWLTGRNVFKDHTNLILSPHLNLVRGVPALFPTEVEHLKCTSRPFVWTGALTFDGCGEINERLSPIQTSDAFLTFGTVCFDEELYRRVLQSLSPLPWRATVTSFHISVESILKEEFPQASNITSARYIPNELALKHTRVIVHHGGVGTSLAAVLAGVPQLICPLNTDTSCQEYHANNLEALGVALTIRPDSINPDSMHEALHKLTSFSFQDAALRLAIVTKFQHQSYSANLAHQLMERIYD